MKIIWLFNLLLVLTACSQTNKKTIPTESIEWETLTGNNYSINYPSNWDVKYPKIFGAKFFLFSRHTSPKDKFLENVNLIIQDLSAYNWDLNKFVDVSENQIKTLATDGVILESKRVQGEYQEIIYTSRQGVFDLKTIQYYWVKNQKAYILTLTCEQLQFDNYQKIGKEILDSFKFDN